MIVRVVAFFRASSASIPGGVWHSAFHWLGMSAAAIAALVPLESQAAS